MPTSDDLRRCAEEQAACAATIREQGMPTGRDLGAALGAQDWLREELLIRGDA